MWLPSVLAPGRAGYFAVTYVLLAACALATLWVIAALPGTAPWVWAASPALLVYGALNWDLFGIFPLAAGLWLWASGRQRAAVAVLSLAVWTKLFPVLVLGVLLLVSLRSGARKGLTLAAIFLAITLALNLPLALWGWPRWTWFFEYNAIREIEPSLYLLFGADPRTGVGRANAFSAIAVVAAAAAIAIVELHTRRLDPLRAACALVCVFLIVNAVYSPQYWLWVVAFAALRGAARMAGFRRVGAGAGRLCGQLLPPPSPGEQAWAQAIWFDHAVFWPTVALRYAALGACAVWAFAHMVANGTCRLRRL
jgi:hypothetical protein